MRTGISRRGLLRGIAHSAAISSLAAALPRHVRAAGAATPAAAAPARTTYCMSMLYPSGEGLTFDGDKFRDQHIPLLKSAYGEGMQRVELRVAPPPPAPAEGAPPPPAPPLLAAVSIWLGNVDKFIAGQSAHAREMAADMGMITKSAPMVQFDNVVADLGGARDSVMVDALCLSLMFPVKDLADNKGAATWDSKGFATDYLPKLYAAFGPEAIRRIEVDQGATAVGGGKLLMLGAVNTYIADEAKYAAAAGGDAAKQLGAMETTYYNAPPFPSLMRVHAIG